jgi:hypothetical protein
MKRLGSLLALLLLVGCATPPSSPRSSVGSGATLVTGPRPRVENPRDFENVGRTIAPVGAPAERVWAVLPAVFRELQLEADLVDRRILLIGVTNLRLRRIAGDSPGRFVDCGQGISGNYADTYDVYLTLRTQAVRAGTDGTEIWIHLDAAARSGSNSGNVLACSSRGTLEARIVELIQERLAG